MGSSQSAPSPPPSDPSSALEGDTFDSVALPQSSLEKETQSSKSKTASSKPPLTGMALVNHQCRKPKRKYDKCVARWYKREFLTGQGTLNQSEACGDVFETYRICILKGIKREVWDKNGYPPPLEGSPLAELDDDDDDAVDCAKDGINRTKETA